MWIGRRGKKVGSRSSLGIIHRDVTSEAIPEGGGTEVFDTSAAWEINAAGPEHLDSFGLSIADRRVLDVGGGVGHLAQHFAKQECEVVSTDAHEENVSRMREFYPNLVARQLNVETGDILEERGRYRSCVCYGLLYHLENSLLALRKLVAATSDLLLIETMVCDPVIPVLRLDDEMLSLNQALRGLAHRPSLSYVTLTLDRMGMEFVYRPIEPPDHPDYHYQERNDYASSRDGHPLRAVCVASRHALHLPALRPMVPSSS